MHRKLNILEVVFSQSWGGLELSACDFTNKFMNMGHFMRMVSPTGSRIASFCNENNVPHISINPKLKYIDLITAWKLSRIIKRYNIDIIHAHISKDLSTIALAKTLSRTGKVVFTQHMDSRYPKRDLFHRWVIKRIDMIATVTKSVLQNVLIYSAATHNQVQCIYNGVDLNKFKPARSKEIRRRCNIADDANVIGLVARLDRLKKQELLLEAAPAVLEKCPNTYFIFVGDETPSKTGIGYKNILTELIKRKNLSNHFKFINFTPNITEIYGLFDIVVLTTPKETFGMVLVEAMAMGIPVIGTDAGGVKEIIDDGKNGLLFEPDSARELSECIVTLLADKNLRCSMGKQGIKKVKETFDSEKNLGEYERLFYSLIAPSFM